MEIVVIASTLVAAAVASWRWGADSRDGQDWAPLAAYRGLAGAPGDLDGGSGPCPGRSGGGSGGEDPDDDHCARLGSVTYAGFTAAAAATAAARQGAGTVAAASPTSSPR